MEFFKKKTQIDFLKLRKYATAFSVFLFVASITTLSLKGLNLGLDFSGGTQVELGYQQSADLPAIRSALKSAGFEDPVVQTYGSSHDILVRIGQSKALSHQQITQEIQRALPDAEVKQAEFIGPQVGKTLISHGVLAILVSLLATMAYIAMRFEYRFAISAAIALIHDPILILGVFSACQIEFNLISLAALLTVIGYSLNDTIVVYDRVRENFRKLTKGSATDVMNQSINETLSRTIMTSSLTLVVVLALLFLGGEMLFGFSLALAVGILVGTYSSIYVAGGVAVMLGLDRQHLVK